MTGLLKLLGHSLWNLLRQRRRFLLSAFILVKRETFIVNFGFGTVTQISGNLWWITNLYTLLSMYVTVVKTSDH